jgi:uncharacterized protein (DUF1800 family)
MRSAVLRHVIAGACLWLPAQAQITVTVSPSPASLHAGTFLQFSARVSGNANTAVTWAVALPAGGKGSAGSITNTGRYTPPGTLPSPNVVLVSAISAADPTVSAVATVTILNPFPSVASASPTNVAPGAFILSVNGSGFVPGAQILFGGSPVPTNYVSATKVTAFVWAGKAEAGRSFPLQVVNPDPGSAPSDGQVSVAVAYPVAAPPIVSANTASRFLDQAAFGPDAATVAHLQAVGIDAYLTEQFNAPPSPYPDPNKTGFGLGQVQARFFTNAVHGPDQLRQRVAFALSQIFVVSSIVESTPAQLVPYLETLQQDAFGNFLTLMTDVTLSPTMGEYLNMLNNDQADPTRGTKANENYARELMQLFTLGLLMLNPDGTLQLDANGQPIPTYQQADIAEFARVYTGWTYATIPGATPLKHNPANYAGPMVAFESNHDMGSKTLLNGVVLPAGQTAEQDLAGALMNIFSHPNVAPFVTKNLIQHLITSNPSPGYISRVAAVFNDNGRGVRGDLKAVVRAILLDPEARAEDAGIALSSPDTSGHLREPVFFVASVLRGLGALVNDTNGLTGQASALGQTIFTPASVFNYYAPGYRIPTEFTPGLALLGPEFQLQSPATAVARANVSNTMIFGNLGTGAVVDLTSLSNLASDPARLVAAVNTAFFHGRMPSALEKQIEGAVSGTTDNLNRARTAVYLAVSSSYYGVEH